MLTNYFENYKGEWIIIFISQTVLEYIFKSLTKEIVCLLPGSSADQSAKHFPLSRVKPQGIVCKNLMTLPLVFLVENVSLESKAPNILKPEALLYWPAKWKRWMD